LLEPLPNGANNYMTYPDTFRVPKHGQFFQEYLDGTLELDKSGIQTSFTKINT